MTSVLIAGVGGQGSIFAARLLGSTTGGYNSCQPENAYANIRQGKISYALLPVWILNEVFVHSSLIAHEFSPPLFILSR